MGFTIGGCTSSDPAAASAEASATSMCPCTTQAGSGLGEISLACSCGAAGCPDRKTFVDTACNDDKPHAIITKELVYAGCNLTVFTNPDRNGIIRYVFDGTTGALVGYAASTDVLETCNASEVTGFVAGRYEVPSNCVLSFEGNPCGPRDDAGGSDAADPESGR